MCGLPSTRTPAAWSPEPSSVTRHLRTQRLLATFHTMPRPRVRDGLTKFQRYRQRRRAQGLKLLQIWVPDPRARGFRQEARRQAALLRRAPEQLDATAFIEAAGDWPE